MFKGKYDIFVAMRALQHIELNPSDENIHYHHIEEVGEVEEVFVYDLTTQHLVANFQWDPYDDHEMYKRIREAIRVYEAAAA